MWQSVCPASALTPDRGVAALAPWGTQVAIFRLSSGEIYAVGNRDPFSGAHVLSRGIVGDHGGVPTVASPVYKQRFDLRTGVCLDDPAVWVPTFLVRVSDDGVIEVSW